MRAEQKIPAVKSPKVPKRAYGHKVLARLKDGVLLLAPASRPKSFTTREIDRTIRQVLKERAERAHLAGKRAGG